MLNSTKPRLLSHTVVGRRATRAKRGVTAWNTSVVYGVRLADDDGWKIAFTRFPVLLVLGNAMSSGVGPLAVVLERDREMEDLDVGAAASSELVVPVCVGVGARELWPDVGRIP